VAFFQAKSVYKNASIFLTKKVQVFSLPP